MVKNLVLFDKIYNISKARGNEDIFLRYLKYLNEHMKGFPDTSIKIKKLRDFDKRFELEIQGPEEVFVLNLIKAGELKAMPRSRQRGKYLIDEAEFEIVVEKLSVRVETQE